MEETVAETQSLERPHVHCDDTLNKSGARFLQHPSSRSWTGHRGTSTHTASLGGNHIRQETDVIPICRDYIRGTCTRGTSCKYYHAESVERGRSRFYQIECGALGVVANLGNSLSYRDNKDNDSRTRFASAGYRSRSPCRKFRSGTCFRGAACQYLHDEVSRNDTPKRSVSVEEHQVHGAVRIPGFGKEDGNNTSRISQGQEEANKENNLRTMTFSGGKRSRSPCRNFLRGNCNFGSHCRRLHPVNTFVRSRTDFSSQHHQRFAETGSNPGCNEGHRDVSLRTPQGQDESSMHDSLRTGTFLREVRRRSPCRNFLGDKCHRGESCANLHLSRVYDRTRYDSWRTQQCDGAPATSGSPHLNDGTVGNVSRPFQNHEDYKNPGIQPRCDVYHVNQARATVDGMQYIGNRENMDATSRSWSSERHKSSNASYFRRDKSIRELEVCLRFTRGRCNFGDSCRYLHGYHEYASSKCSTRPAEAAADSMTFDVANQHANTMMVQQHNDVCKTAKLDTLDQKGDASVIDGKKCEIPEEKSSGLCNEEISLWSWPFKRRRSRSRSPLNTLRTDSHCMNSRRYDSRMDLGRDRCHNVVRVQYPECRSYTFDRPMYDANNHKSSIEARTSMNLCYHEKYDPKLVGSQRHGEVVNQGSHTASASKNDETDSAILALQQCHMDQNDKELARDCITADRSQGAAASGQEDLKLDSASSYREQPVSLEAICLSMLEKEGNAEETNDNAAEVMPSMKIYSGKNIKVRKTGQGSVSCEETVIGGAITSKHQEYGSVDNIEKIVEPALASAKISRRKLLVLDINGLLVDIVSIYPHCYKPDTIVSGKGVFKRPFCDDFLHFCFERYDVGIWSSRNKKNVTKVLNFLLKDTQKRLLFCWDQSHCTPTGYNTLENREKPLVLKELKNLWDNKDKSLPWKKGYYNETNTILLDDSPYKALRNPPYTAIFPYPYKFQNVQDKSLGPGGDLRVYLERLAEAENTQKFIQENPFGQTPITKEHKSWAFYAKIISTDNGIQLEKFANIVGTCDGSQQKEKDEIVGTSNGSVLEEKAEIVGTSGRSRIEEKAKIIVAFDGSQIEEKHEIVGTCNGILLEDNAEIVGTFDRSGIEEKAKTIGAFDESQQEEKTNVVTSH